jgi:hypothetical protein
VGSDSEKGSRQLGQGKSLLESESEKESPMKKLLIPLILVLSLLAGCEALNVFSTQPVKDAAITSLEEQVNEKAGVIDGLRESLESMAQDVADRQQITDAERAQLEADIASIAEKMDAAQGTYGPLLEALASARDKPTAGEAFGDIGQAASALLPYPFNLIGGMLLTGMFGAGATARRKNGQLSAVVESVSIGRSADGNGGLDMAAMAKHQKDSGVQSLVDSLLTAIEVKNVKG